MQVKNIAILSTFIKIAFVIKIFVSSIFEWQLKTWFKIACIFHVALCTFNTCEQHMYSHMVKGLF